MMSAKVYKSTIVCIYTFQFTLIVLFAIFCKYDKNADGITESNSKNDEMIREVYPIFQDINIMVFVGFGLLLSYLRRYGFSALGFTYLISALLIQWSTLCYGFFRLDPLDGRYNINILSVMNGVIITVATLISFCAVLGKISPIQLLFMGIIETALAALNEYLGSEILQVSDAGGSIYIHTFGAYFGLALSFVMGRGLVSSPKENDLEGSSYRSDIIAMAGTLFLWVFWPSFNAGLLTGNNRHRAIINTYLALTASCAVTFATSSLINKKNKFDMVDIQNATLAGGVCIGSVANMMVQPYGALLIGSFAGILSTVGFEVVQGWLLKKMRLHDTAGINNLHGMPGVASGLISALMAVLAQESVYGQSLTDVFPAMGPETGRSESEQAGYQILGLMITLIVSVIGGLVTGISIRSVGRITEFYNDALYWKLPDDEDQKEENMESLRSNNDIILPAVGK